MTLPVPNQQTWSPSELVTAAMMNSNVRDAVNFLANPPLFTGYQSVAQTLTNGATTAILLDSEVADTYNGHSTSTNTDRYVAQVAGYYLGYGATYFAANATGQRIGLILKNGSAFGIPVAMRTTVDAASAGATEVPASGVVYLNAGDYMQLGGIQTSGGNLNTNANGSYFYVFWMHA